MNLDSAKRRVARRAPAKTALRSQVRETVRAAILDAAEELIAAKGLQGTALAQIAKRAGVAVGTLYNYFEDRDALVRALFETRRATLRPQVLAAIAGGRALPFEPRLRRFMRELFEAFDTHRAYVKVAFAAEHLKPTGSHQDLLNAIDELVAAGIAEGVIARETGDVLSIMIAGAVRSVLIRRVETTTPFVADAEAVVSLLLDGARRRR